MGEQERRARLRQLAEDGVVPGKVTEHEAASELAWRFVEEVVSPGLCMAAAEIQETMPRRIATVGVMALYDPASRDVAAVRLAIVEKARWGGGIIRDAELDVVIQVEGACFGAYIAGDAPPQTIKPEGAPESRSEPLASDLANLERLTADDLADIAVERYVAGMETMRHRRLHPLPRKRFEVNSSRR